MEQENVCALCGHMVEDAQTICLNCRVRLARAGVCVDGQPFHPGAGKYTPGYSVRTGEFEEGETAMTFQIEARANRTSPTRGRASVHIVFDEGSSMTVSNIEVREEDGKLTVKLPPAGRRPDTTFQGELKRQMEDAVKKAFRAAVYMWAGVGRK